MSREKCNDDIIIPIEIPAETVEANRTMNELKNNINSAFNCSDYITVQEPEIHLKEMKLMNNIKEVVEDKILQFKKLVEDTIEQAILEHGRFNQVVVYSSPSIAELFIPTIRNDVNQEIGGVLLQYKYGHIDIRGHYVNIVTSNVIDDFKIMLFPTVDEFKGGITIMNAGKEFIESLNIPAS